MEHEDAERYALGALFTLALHDTARISTASDPTGQGVLDSPWGAPPWLDEDSDSQEPPKLTPAEWDAYWGWDCVAPGGLLELVYQQLRIPPSKWAGLKRLPQVGSGTAGSRPAAAVGSGGGSSSSGGVKPVPLELIRSFVEILDQELAASLPLPAAPAQRRTAGAAGIASGASAASLLGPGAVTHSGYLPSVDDMLLHGEVPPEERSEQQEGLGQARAGGGPQAGLGWGLAGADVGPESPSSPADQGTPTPTAVARSVRDDLWDGLLSSSDDSEWEVDDAREQSRAAARRAQAAADPSLAAGGQQLNGQPDFADEQYQIPTPSADGQTAAGTGVIDAAAMLADPAGEVGAAGAGGGPRGGPAGSLAVGATHGRDDLQEGPQPETTATTAGTSQPAGMQHQGGEGGAGAAAPRSSSPVSPHALGALWELVQCCVGTKRPPPATAAAASNGAVQEGGEQQQQHAQQDGQRGEQATDVHCGADDEAGGEAGVDLAGAAAAEEKPTIPPAMPSSEPDTPVFSSRGSGSSAVPGREESGQGMPRSASIRCDAVPARSGSSKGPQQGEREGEQQDGEGGEGQRCRRSVQLRWYDARARVALKQVAAWLQVPWRKVANFELLLANQKAPTSSSSSAQEGKQQLVAPGEGGSWRWLKVGAAAVGGGALFAVTGGLAAPALAAGLSSVISFAGVHASVAGAVTGFMASSGGAITLASTLGAAGATSTGSKMAYRTAEVSEFGFRELPQLESEWRHSAGISSNISSSAVKGGDGQGPVAAAATEPGDDGPSDIGDSTIAPAAARSAEQAPTFPVLVEQEPPAREGTEPASLQAADSAHLVGSPEKRSRPASRATSEAQLAHNSSTGPAGAAADAGSRSSGLGGQAGAAAAAAPPTLAMIEAPAESQQHLGTNSSDDGGATTAGSAAAAAPAAGERDDDSGEPSAWQRWFGSRKEEAHQVLPVPLRIRSAGDVRLSALICVCGWITDPDDYVMEWEGIRWPDADMFSLVWESRELLALNSALGVLVAKQAASQGAQFAVQHFFYAGAGILSALAPALLLDTATGLLIENAWSVAVERSIKAGKLLAAVLAGGGHGDRPVTLVAHSMGARLVFHCLLELYRCGCRGVVQDVVLLGTPVSSGPERWRMARSAVAGRLINCYSRRDWLLGVVYTGSSGFTKAAAGLCPVEVAGIENVNLTSVVGGHFEYMPQLPEVLDSMGLTV
ncbi:hypothetical protein N2152v2_008267 [Parachlorella kessleri]